VESSADIGLISDTHGLLRDQAIRALNGVDLILHAGDVGDPAVLEGLRRIAPVRAIRGNVDVAPWAAALPESDLVKTPAATFYLVHSLADLDLNPRAAGIDIVLCGHSHRPEQRQQDGVLLLNPGSAGPRRFSLPITLGRLNLNVKPWKMQLIDLSGDPK
jgi:uncharacterized protein